MLEKFRDSFGWGTCYEVVLKLKGETSKFNNFIDTKIEDDSINKEAKKYLLKKTFRKT